MRWKQQSEQPQSLDYVDPATLALRHLLSDSNPLPAYLETAG